MRILFSLLILSFISLMACQSETKSETSASEDENCVNPKADPKPMALRMRALYEQAKAMHEQIKSGKAVTAKDFPVMEFHTLQATDSTVVTPAFLEKADAYYTALRDLQEKESALQAAAFNHLLQTCIQCHMENCPGPIKKIRQLQL